MNYLHISFQDIVNDYLKIGWARRLASIDKNGNILKSSSRQNIDEYVRQVRNSLTAVEAGISQCHQIRRQLENPPSSDWLNKVKISRLDFLQQQADFLTLISHSLFDRTLLLINETYCLNLAPKSCKGKAIKEKVNVKGADHQYLLSILNELDLAVSKIANDRNKFAHRGDEREYPEFTSFRRTQSVISSFDIPTGNIKFDQASAENSLVCFLLDEYLQVVIATGKIFPSLIPEFQNQISLKGGIGKLSIEEKKRASSVENYFKGGPLPSHWAD